MGSRPHASGSPLGRVPQDAAAWPRGFGPCKLSEASFLLFYVEIVIETCLVDFLVLFWGGEIVRQRGVCGGRGAGRWEPASRLPRSRPPTERRRVRGGPLPALWERLFRSQTNAKN